MAISQDITHKNNLNFPKKYLVMFRRQDRRPTYSAPEPKVWFRVQLNSGKAGSAVIASPNLNIDSDRGPCDLN